MRYAFFLLIITMLAGLAGCAICCSPYDYAYPAYGGKWQRQQMNHGRVGSVLAPAGDFVAAPEGMPAEVVPPPAAPSGPMQ